MNTCTYLLHVVVTALNPRDLLNSVFNKPLTEADSGRDSLQVIHDPIRYDHKTNTESPEHRFEEKDPGH